MSALFEWLRELKKKHVDDASDYVKGRRKGIALGMGIWLAISLISVYRSRKTRLYPEIWEALRQEYIKKHGHDLPFREPVIMENCQVEQEFQKSVNPRGFRNAFGQGNWSQMEQDLGKSKSRQGSKSIGVLGR